MIKTAKDIEDMTKSELLEHLNDTVKPEVGEIPAYVLADPKVYDLEHKKVFMKTWIFIGHESEIPNKNDYMLRDLAGYSIIVSRNADSSIKAFYNMCTHRGMKLCRADKGNKSAFVCPYHGFNFKNNGDLIGVPLQKNIYGEELDKSTMGLTEVRIESYKGLLFGTWNDEAESLDDFLGDFKWYLDILVGRAEMEVLGAPQRFVIHSNWKIGADNFVGDSYHTMVTHGSIAKLGMVPSATYSKMGYQIHSENGHGLNLGTPNPDFAFPEELIEEYKSNLSSEQFEVLSNLKNMIGNIFPHLSFLISHTKVKGQLISNTTVRLWRPIDHDKMEVIAWFLVEKNAPEDWKRRSRESFVLTFSPSGIFEQDDTEVFTDITAAAKGPMPVMKNLTYNYTMGLHRKPVDFIGPGVAYDDKFSEANQRNFYKYWLELMNS
ncbi:aromatic ring-hydroxylating dioxygenase subunit alpha [Cytobacillus sp. FSL W7-1323]|uniref:Aromatic ring-hydroxylating dioxygenase subunit alpha n=1 Tax=Cytobacillus kochii TaxID=859143 RepID=A0A248TNW9_9BACI|nr:MULTISPECIES: aromatic ring-hydroxylating dioxygenase subunit alpha [Cytobacillus]ASV69887.1 aromatic ring-hydroxylating dioxygenase subunit alpha [Cytobacillus kochii]MDQ0184684.1 phenylpropionate dioxygenase-like ring-hydroxylating dioxygenase large terminal subunit [Cytobacillus kochii]MEA1852099.1 aromatic ring-hydroxylating dioxygenase subunit alpha [Cytobacillus sp. OWB-43]MED1606628.1 aromatic ring-hydroxylating dioxygenase subunit alpha [Cytobacillus kochii]